MPNQHSPLDLRVTIIPDAEPSPAYLALWRRLLAPLPTPPSPEPCVTDVTQADRPPRGKGAGDAP